MNWKSVSKLVGKAAPLLGTALGGPAGAAIGSMVATALGVENTPAAVAEAVKNNPEAALKLREFELQNEQHIRDHAFKVLDAELADVQNARSVHSMSMMPAAITVVLTVLNAAYGAALFYIDMPESNRDEISDFAQQLLILWVASVTYWIGTTRSSAEKNRIIGK